MVGATKREGGLGVSVGGGADSWSIHFSILNDNSTTKGGLG